MSPSSQLKNGERNQRESNKGQERSSSKPAADSPKEKKSTGLNERFRVFAHKTSELVGSAWSFILAALTLIIWACLGPVSGFSDTWQLVINTATTIVTFLMVFLIQNTQNRDAKAMHLKLDELIHAVEGARNKLINLEDLSEEELKKLEERFKQIGESKDAPKPRQDTARRERPEST